VIDVEQADPNAAYVDLHSHSTASDGSLPPAHVMEAAHEHHLRAIALTDHDTIDGLEAARIAANRLGVRLVAGCELSAHDEKNEIHLLALHIADVDAIGPHLSIFRQQRIERAQQMVQRLNAQHIPVSFNDVLREADGGVVGRPHVARALVNGGFVPDISKAFDRYLGFGRTAYVPKPQLAIEDAVAIAHQAGALAVWAHPGREGTRDRVRRLVEKGLDGIEIRHPSHTLADITRISELVTEFGLVRSGGSDWHGAAEGYRTLGNMHVPIEWLQEQDARIAARAA
jgi:predicted metal-dependent phosphoesterase TrpH